MASIADMQWVLHNLPNDGAVLEVRGSESGSKKLALAESWKESDISWRGSIWSLSPRLRVWMPELGSEERRERGLPEDRSAYLVRWINTAEPGGRSARDCGLREGDLVVALDGKPVRMSTAQLNMHVKLHYKVGDELPLTVLRGGKEREIKIKLVE